MRRIKLHVLFNVGMSTVTWWGGCSARQLHGFPQAIAFCSKSRLSRLPKLQLQQTFAIISVTRLEGSLSNGTMGRAKCGLQGQRNDGGGNHSSDDIVTSIVQRVVSLSATPLLGSMLKRPLALGNYLVLLASMVLLPLSTSFLVVLSFGLFAWFGRKVVSEEEYDEDEKGDSLPTDTLALGAALLTAGILAPISGTSTPSVPFDVVSADILMGLFIGSALILQISQSGQSEGGPSPLVNGVDDSDEDPDDDPSSNEKRLMTLWDQSLDKANTKENLRDDIL
jgi:hypothetical protein